MNSDLSVVQPAAIRYTDYPTVALEWFWKYFQN
jgi:hypothetical protein